jgi:uncharacterized protein
MPVGAPHPLSPTSLADHLDCPHLATLARQVAAGERVRPYFDDPTREVLVLRGHEHEQRYLDHLRATVAGEIVEIPATPSKDADAWERAAEATTAALRRGAAVVYQATFCDDGWRGRADFLVRVQRPSDLGPWSYQVADTKLARHARGRAIVQLCVYSQMLGRVQGVLPETMRLVLGGDAGVQEHRVADYLAYVRALRGRFLQQLGAGAPPPASGASRNRPALPASAATRLKWRPMTSYGTIPSAFPARPAPHDSGQCEPRSAPVGP